MTGFIFINASEMFVQHELFFNYTWCFLMTLQYSWIWFRKSERGKMELCMCPKTLPFFPSSYDETLFVHFIISPKFNFIFT